MNLLETFKAFLFSQDNKPSKVTVKNYLSDINHFVRWYENKFQKSFSPAEVKRQTIDDYKIQSSEAFSASSIERHLSSLRKFFYFLKLEGLISLNPLEIRNLKLEIQSDPWHIKDFKSYLYVYNASHLTIKNYVIDIKQFLAWAEEVTASKLAIDTKDSNVLNHINSDLIEEYKQRLLTQGQFSPSTINRKLSSLRKYVSWAQAEGLISQNQELGIKNYELPHQGVARGEGLPTAQTSFESTRLEGALAGGKPETGPRTYSPFPPLRLFQKLTKGIIIGLDATLIAQLVNLIEKSEYLLWKTKGQPIFQKVKGIRLPSSFSHEHILGIKNLSKELYAPLDISTKYFPWYKKAWFILRYTRPKWYKRYHSYAIVHYFHFAVLIIFMAGLGFGFYQGFFANQGKSTALAILPTTPPRVLSFQGRLTNNNDNPITANTNLRFAIYNNLTASGAALLWQEVNGVAPDPDGIFNVILGNNTSIPSTLFSENNALWLGVTVQTTAELTPRQQLATVAYATNAETLQDLPPITNSVNTSNVVLALDSSGNLTIGGSANPVFQATGGTFKLSGQPLLLTTNAGSSGDIQIAPDGTGKIDLSKPLVNTLNNNNIRTAIGSVEVDDLFSILATSSSQSAFTLNQTGAGPLISASASGVAKFTVDNAGNTTTAGNGVISGTLTLSSSSPIAFTGTTPITITQTNGSTINWADGTNNLLQIIDNGTNGILNVTGNYQINGTSGVNVSNACVNATGGIITSAGSCPSGVPSTDLYWNQQNGALFPNNSTVDFLVGGQSTASAKFAILNINGTGPATASVSGNLIVMPTNGAGGNVGIGTTTPDSRVQITGGGLCVGSDANCNTDNNNEGVVYSGSTSMTVYDVAENYPTKDTTLVPGEVVTMDPQRGIFVVRSSKPYDGKAIGAISEEPAVLLGGFNGQQFKEEKQVAVTLTGRILVKVTDENGPIKQGDYVTSSSTPGKAMRATRTGPVIGQALEDWNPSSGDNVMVFIKSTFHDPDVYLTSAGNLNILDGNPNTSFEIPHTYTLSTPFGLPIERIGVFAELAVANLRAGFISAQQITTTALTVASENITINGQNIRDYIASIVNDVISNSQFSIFNGQNIISPIASINEVHTDLISPLAQDSQIAIKIDDSKFQILNTKYSSGSAVASIDNLGNASFSGSLAVGKDASISGTLRASKIIADQIEGLNIQASTVSANYITNVTNIYNNEPEAFPTLGVSPSGSSSGESFFGNLFADNNFINIATFSSNLAYVENLNAANAAFSQGLMVFGPTVFSDTSIVGQLSINGDMILSDNSINVLGNDLNLQPLRQGGLSIMAGLIYIDSNGNVKIEGDTTINGTLYAKVISPIPGSDLSIKLGTSSALQNGNLNVKNASGSSILALNQFGDLIASGSATFAKLNLGSLVSPALAISSTEIIATGSAGNAFINSYKTEMTINNAQVTEKSLIYITPTSNTNNQVLFLLRQVPEKSFTVGIPNPSNIPIPFNWIIVN